MCEPLPGACSDKKCQNVASKFECDPRTCPARDFCANRHFTRKAPHTALEIFRTGDRGFGVRTSQPIAKGTFVAEYVGDLIDQSELARRIAFDHQHHIQNFYYLSLDRERTIDASSSISWLHQGFIDQTCIWSTVKL